MKVKLRGGPDHGKVVNVIGGEEIRIPVMYEHESFIGLCNKGIEGHEDCEKPEPLFRKVFSRVYKITSEVVLKPIKKINYYGDYMGEK